MKLRTRIAATYVTLTIVAIAIVSMISSWQIRQFLEERDEATLTAQVSMFAEQFSAGILHVDPSGGSDSTLSSLAHALGTRMTLIGRDGRVLFDTNVPRDSLGLLENHKGRPELRAARRGRVGSDVRESRTVHEEFLYAAAQIHVLSDSILDGGYVRLAFPTGPSRALVSRVQMMVWLVGLVVALCMAAASIPLARRITRPLQGISKMAEAITKGDLRVRIPIAAQDEVGSLATTINTMADTLSTDIERLRKLERVRSEFLANVSHELRTPIFSMQGFLETLIDGAVDDPAVNREFLGKAHKHAERLNTLLNDLIEISRIESGDMKMSHRYFALPEFLAHVVEEMRPEADRKRISLTLVNPLPEDVEVFGDKERLKQVMVNLIDNAIKYTDPGGSVTVRAVADTDKVTISVADTGCGIAEEHLGRIFERFYRVDKDRSREVGGTGLGLAIVKHIVEAHDGTLSVKSTVGKGSEFSFTVKR